MQPDDPIVIRIADAARLLSISRSHAYLLAKRGQLPGAVRLGGSWRVSRAALLDWVSAQAAMNIKAVPDWTSGTAGEVGGGATQPLG